MNSLNSGKDEGYLGLIETYLEMNDVDTNKVEVLLDLVKDKESKYFKEIENKYKRYIDDRATI